MKILHSPERVKKEFFPAPCGFQNFLKVLILISDKTVVN